MNTHSTALVAVGAGCRVCCSASLDYVVHHGIACSGFGDPPPSWGGTLGIGSMAWGIAAKKSCRRRCLRWHLSYSGPSRIMTKYERAGPLVARVTWHPLDGCSNSVPRHSTLEDPLGLGVPLCCPSRCERLRKTNRAHIFNQLSSEANFNHADII